MNYDYLVTGEVTKIRENGAASGVGVLASYGYDDLGRRTSLTRGNGAVTGYGYDAISRLDQMVENLAGTTSDITRTFAYNPASQITSVTRSNDAYGFPLLFWVQENRVLYVSFYRQCDARENLFEGLRLVNRKGMTHNIELLSFAEVPQEKLEALYGSSM